jgi:hypothetical protein
LSRELEYLRRILAEPRTKDIQTDARWLLTMGVISDRGPIALVAMLGHNVIARSRRSVDRDRSGRA